MERYKEFSLKFYTILMAHADDVQAVSVDEALIETTTGVARYEQEHPTCEDPAHDLAELIREKVRKATECESERDTSSYIARPSLTIDPTNKSQHRH